MIAVLFGISSLCMNAQTVAPDNTGMDIDAREWTKGVSMGWNLGNSLESAGAAWDDATGTWNNAWIKDYNQWETAWGNPKTTRDRIRCHKSASEMGAAYHRLFHDDCGSRMDGTREGSG